MQDTLGEMDSRHHPLSLVIGSVPPEKIKRTPDSGPLRPQESCIDAQEQHRRQRPN